MTDRTRHLSPAMLKVLAVAAISLAALPDSSVLAATAAVVGLICFAWSLVLDQSGEDRHSFRWAGFSVIVILLVGLPGTVGAMPVPAGAVRATWVGLLVLASVLAIVSGHRNLLRRASVVTALLAVIVTTSVMTVQEWRADLGLDVYWMHRAAGEALFEGENPYTDKVTVSSGSPYAPEGEVIEGYPYPPVVLGTYGVSGAEGDPRIISTVSWLGLLAWMAWRAWKTDPVSNTAYSMLLLLAGLAVWPVSWFASWTEPLSVALFLLVAVWWRRRPVLSALALGLAIASKQYFIFLAPLLLLHRDDSKRMRLMVAFGIASLTILTGIALDPRAYVDATIWNLSEIGFRPDTQSLSGMLASSGIEFYLSPVTWVVTGLLISAIVAIGSNTASDLIARSGLALGLIFFFGQAFPNYWLLVLALFAVASVVSVGSRSENRNSDRNVNADSIARAPDGG